MAESFIKHSDPVNNSEKTKDNTLGQYFDNNVHTIFDEIISKSEVTQSLQKTTQDICKLNIMSEISTDLLKNENTFNIERSELPSKDSHSDGWIPCEQTRKILRSIATSTFSNNVVDRENLTMPGLTIQDDMIDTVKATSIHFFGEDENIHRNILTATDVTQDERGLRNLIQTGCYRAAVDLSGRLLAVYGQGYGKINHLSKHTPHSLQLWYTRLSLLLKLKQFDILKAESEPFGNLDKPDMYFTFYPELYGTRHGSMASFAFRLLLAEIPLYYGKTKDAINNLYKLLSVINQIIKNLEAGLTEEGGVSKYSETDQKNYIKLWVNRKSRVQISIVNCALTVNNFKLAINVLEELLKSANWTKEQSEILKSAIGRIYLFLGDVLMAEKIFGDVKKNSEELPSIRELIDRGLMAVAQNSYQEGYNHFKIASSADPSNIMLINNMAVCLLYTGQLKAAVQLLENAVTRNPVKCLQERVLLNLSTLYELHTTHSKQCKLHLLRLLNRYTGDHIDISCLKLV
ncbi:trafficking protein particle complex subunit 12 [Chelonus insularis]|uniref:trafficking protein particle complex subunit 12 n=1 Tax=Chelonus insularis TaxID=460826 RepID=UPI00158A5BF4|nr:trafficking protein particle complex subunit 12 [Chelonus insularis]